MPPFPEPAEVSERILLVPFARAKAMPRFSLKQGRAAEWGRWFRWFGGSGGPPMFLLRLMAGVILFNVKTMVAILRSIPAFCVWGGRLSRIGFQCDIGAMAAEVAEVGNAFREIQVRDELAEWRWRQRRMFEEGWRTALEGMAVLNPRAWLLRGRIRLMGVVQAATGVPAWGRSIGRTLAVWGAEGAAVGRQYVQSVRSFARRVRSLRLVDPISVAGHLPEDRCARTGIIWLRDILDAQREDMGWLLRCWGWEGPGSMTAALLRQAVMEAWRERREAARRCLRRLPDAKRRCAAFWLGGTEWLRGAWGRVRLKGQSKAESARRAPARTSQEGRTGRQILPGWTWGMQLAALGALLSFILISCLGSSMFIGECFIRIEARQQHLTSQQYLAMQRARNGHLTYAMERVTYRLTEHSASAFLDIRQTEHMIRELRKQYRGEATP